MKLTKGVDTTFLIQLEISELPEHQAAKTLLSAILDRKELLAIAPQVLTEFIHVITDPKRFTTPLTMPQAIERAKFWWDTREVHQVTPSENVPKLTLDWLERFNLGRKRILDTQLAATYFSAGISNIISSNQRDFGVFGCFNVIVPG